MNIVEGENFYTPAVVDFAFLEKHFLQSEEY